MQQCKAAAIGENDDQIHRDERQIVVPAISFLSPETGVPHENLFIDRTEQNQDQAEGGQLGKNAEHDSQAAQDFARAEKNGEILAHANAFAANLRIFEVSPAAGEEHYSNHQSE